ncbi:hypothetical protein FXO37_17337 [Capsicum annuum]|nr:hypothetical protein FXO37_17337 [Capsicum annuum]
MELFGATTIRRQILLEGGLLVVDDGSGSGSGVAVGTNDVLLQFLKQQVVVTLEATSEEYNIIVDNPSIAFKEEEKMEPVLAVVVLKERRIRVYDSMSQRRSSGPSDWDLFVATYAEYLSDGLQVPNNGLDVGLLQKRYASLLWKYGEAKAQKPYASNIKDPQRSRSNSAAPDEEQLVYID